MKVCIVGGELSGKTTLFALLTEAGDGKFHSGLKDVNIGVAKIPDSRLDYLSSVFNPKKTTYAQIDLVDVPGPIMGKATAKSEAFAQLRLSDAALVVLRCFESDLVPWPGEVESPAGALRRLIEEELIQDMDVAGKALEKAKSPKGKLKDWEIATLDKVNEWLNSEKPLWAIGIESAEEVFLRGYTFLTSRPHVCAVNVGEEALASGHYLDDERLRSYCAELGLPIVEFSGAVEAEISALPQNEQKEFLKEYGLDEPGITRIARTLYSHMGLISFFTVGEDEVRAWTIRSSTRAQEAAGKIHSDMERGFIRAEVVSFEEFKHHGSMKALKQAGLLRLESKDYIVRDGDILTIRFNV